MPNVDQNEPLNFSSIAYWTEYDDITWTNHEHTEPMVKTENTHRIDDFMTNMSCASNIRAGMPNYVDI